MCSSGEPETSVEDSKDEDYNPSSSEDKSEAYEQDEVSDNRENDSYEEEEIRTSVEEDSEQEEDDQDPDYDKKKKNKRRKTAARNLGDGEDVHVADALPLDCSICKEPLSIPSVIYSDCNHHLCKKCALKHRAENNSKCVVCEKGKGVVSEWKKKGTRSKKKLGDTGLGQKREKAKALVKEASDMLGKASEMVAETRVDAATAGEMATKASTMAAEAAAKAEKAMETALKAVDMVEQAWVMMDETRGVAKDAGLMGVQSYRLTALVGDAGDTAKKAANAVKDVDSMMTTAKAKVAEAFELM